MSLNLIPSTSTPLTDLLTRAAFAPIENVGWIRVTGADRVRWLNGMVTNNIAALKPGEGCYNFFLNAQGRIQADATAWLLEDSILLETAADRLPALIAMLDHFIIMDDVELAEMRHYYGLVLAGPNAEELLSLAALSGLAVPVGPGLHHVTLAEDDNGNPFEIIRADDTLVPRFEVWCYDQKRDAILGFIGTNLNTVEATPEALEHLRILSGTPLYGIDIRDKDRIRSRGAVHRTFSGFILSGEPAVPGTILSSQDKPIGELTSVTTLSSQLLADSYHLPETSSLQIALGYIRREALDRAASITYPGGTATPAALPFQLPELRA